MVTKPTREESGAFALGWASRLLEAGLLLALPLVFYRGFAEQFTYAKVVLTKFLVILALAVWALDFVWGRVRSPAGLRLGAPLGLLATAILLTSVTSQVPVFSVTEAEYFLCAPLWLFLLVSWRRSEADVRTLGGMIAAAGAAVAAVAVLQWTGHDPLLFGGYRVQYGSMVARMRLYSTFGNPNFVCGYLIGAIFPAAALALTLRKRIRQIACGLATALMLVAIAGTGSYGGWAALGVGVLVASIIVWWGGRRAAQRRAEEKAGNAGSLRMALAPVWIGALCLVASVDQLLSSRIAGRVYLSRIGWQMFAEHPLLGSGWGTFQLRFLDFQSRFLAAHPDWTRFWTNVLELHNDLLQLLIETGLLGFAAFCWLLAKYGRQVWQAAGACESRTKIIWLGAASGGATAILADSLVNFQFAIAPTLILLFTFLAFPHLLGKEKDSPQPKPRKKHRLFAGEQRVFLIRALGAIIVTVFCAFLLVQTAQRVLAERDYALGLDFESRGDWAGAERVDRRGIARTPQLGKLHFALARVLYLQREYEPALAEAELAESTYSDSHLIVLKARILDRMGRAQEAIASYRRALHLDPRLKTVQPDIDRLANTLQKPSAGQTH
jgi:O-antigen ligase